MVHELTCTGRPRWERGEGGSYTGAVELEAEDTVLMRGGDKVGSTVLVGTGLQDAACWMTEGERLYAIGDITV